MESKIKKIADIFGVQMKKGFLSALILLILGDKKNSEEEINDCYGVKIIEEIEEKTLGEWKPTAATIYPLLDRLKKKNLIEVLEDKSQGGKVIYKITKGGEQLLNILLGKYQRIVQSMRSILFSAFGYDGNYVLEDISGIVALLERLPEDAKFGWANGIPKNEKLNNLNIVLNTIEEIIVQLEEHKHKFEAERSILQKEGK